MLNLSAINDNAGMMGAQWQIPEERISRCASDGSHGAIEINLENLPPCLYRLERKTIVELFTEHVLALTNAKGFWETEDVDCTKYRNLWCVPETRVSQTGATNLENLELLTRAPVIHSVDFCVRDGRRMTIWVNPVVSWIVGSLVARLKQSSHYFSVSLPDLTTIDRNWLETLKTNGMVQYSPHSEEGRTAGERFRLRKAARRTEGRVDFFSQQINEALRNAYVGQPGIEFCRDWADWYVEEKEADYHSMRAKLTYLLPRAWRVTCEHPDATVALAEPVVSKATPKKKVVHKGPKQQKRYPQSAQYLGHQPRYDFPYGAQPATPAVPVYQYPHVQHAGGMPPSQRGNMSGGHLLPHQNEAGLPLPPHLIQQNFPNLLQQCPVPRENLMAQHHFQQQREQQARPTGSYYGADTAAGMSLPIAGGQSMYAARFGQSQHNSSPSSPSSFYGTPQSFPGH